MKEATHSCGTRAHIWLFVLVTLPFFGLDQASKLAVVRNIGFDDERVIVPGFFALVQWHNTGAAFSILSNSNPLFIAISVVALVALGVLAARGAFAERVSRIAWALLLAGILGNLTDRLLYGYVVDFLLFDLHVPFAHPWPAFNIADACICSATGLFMLQSFREPKTETATKAAE